VLVHPPNGPRAATHLPTYPIHPRSPPPQTNSVLVTHQTELTLPGAAHAVRVENGRIAYQGPASDAPPLLPPTSSSFSSQLALTTSASPSPPPSTVAAAHANKAKTIEEAEEAEEEQDEEKEDEATALLRHYGRGNNDKNDNSSSSSNNNNNNNNGRRGRITQDEAAVSAAVMHAAAAAAAAREEGEGVGWLRRIARRMRRKFAAYEVGLGGLVMVAVVGDGLGRECVCVHMDVDGGVTHASGPAPLPPFSPPCPHPGAPPPYSHDSNNHNHNNHNTTQHNKLKQGYCLAAGRLPAFVSLPLFTLGFAGLNVVQSWLLKDWIHTMQREGRRGGGAVRVCV
jgi:hypothetical protein